MDLGLNGRVAIVAAASKGLGRAVAERLAREGASVAICARTARDLELTAAQIQQDSGREVFWRPVDVADKVSIARFVGEVEARFSRIDICVTNTGGPPAKLFADTSAEDWRTAIDELLMSAVFFAKETLPRMVKRRWGRFLTITSYSVKQPVDGLLLSNSLRAAVTGLVRTLANEYAAHGITETTSAPAILEPPAWTILREAFPRARASNQRRFSPTGSGRFLPAASARLKNLPLWWVFLRPSAPAT